MIYFKLLRMVLDSLEGNLLSLESELETLIWLPKRKNGKELLQVLNPFPGLPPKLIPWVLRFLTYLPTSWKGIRPVNKY